MALDGEMALEGCMVLWQYELRNEWITAEMWNVAYLYVVIDV